MAENRLKRCLTPIQMLHSEVILIFSSFPSLTVDGIHAPSLSAAITARIVIRATEDRGRSVSGHQAGFRAAGSTSLITPLNVLKSQISPRSYISLIGIECSINFVS